MKKSTKRNIIVFSILIVALIGYLYFAGYLQQVFPFDTAKLECSWAGENIMGCGIGGWNSGYEGYSFINGYASIKDGNMIGVLKYLDPVSNSFLTNNPECYRSGMTYYFNDNSNGQDFMNTPLEPGHVIYTADGVEMSPGRGSCSSRYYTVSMQYSMGKIFNGYQYALVSITLNNANDGLVGTYNISGKYNFSTNSVVLPFFQEYYNLPGTLHSSDVIINSFKIYHKIPGYSDAEIEAMDRANNVLNSVTIVPLNQTFFRFDNNLCTQIIISPLDKTANDYSTLTECNSKIVNIVINNTNNTVIDNTNTTLPINNTIGNYTTSNGTVRYYCWQKVGVPQSVAGTTSTCYQVESDESCDDYHGLYNSILECQQIKESTNYLLYAIIVIVGGLLLVFGYMVFKKVFK